MAHRILVEKKHGFDLEAQSLRNDIVQTLKIEGLAELRIVNCYDMEGVLDTDLDTIANNILSEPNVDNIYKTSYPLGAGEIAFRMAYLPGQYDQRADSALQCIEIVTLKDRPEMVTSKIIVLKGSLSEANIARIKAYLINPVESHEVSLDIPQSVGLHFGTPAAVPFIEGFRSMDGIKLEAFRVEMGLAMTYADLLHIQNYFSRQEEREPTLTEIKVIDTYWSDHCRHTTFMTEITEVEIQGNTSVKKAYDAYLDMRKYVFGATDRPVSLMDLATINMKALRKSGGLDDLDISEEINACSIEVKVDVDGKEEPWLLMFKNETHNHPTEIEPYGGAATCLGGAIRDPLSGRSYVYQSMRVTGAADPNQPIEETIEGKLPQKVITQKAAAGFSAYGNQIGLATGHVAEVYDDGFLAKRMEVGAVIGAAPKANVVRKSPEPGDVIVLIGGRTGRDGIGGATGSSKAHDEESLLTCGAEVQKGNPPEERKIQRLFRNPKVTQLIKRCNDFGAGGVSVAIGELADSLEIDLDAVPRKYEGLDGTEIAISESQERMAIVIEAEDVLAIQTACNEENLEATVVAKVTDTGRLVMHFRGQTVIDLSRAFLDTNGVRGKTKVVVEEVKGQSPFKADNAKPLIERLAELNICSQKGLVERFDNTIGSGTVVMPFGGAFELTPAQAMVAKLPVLTGETETVSLMSYGYDPEIGKWSPFHGGLYAVVDSVAKIVATGGDVAKVRLSLQEYFERLGTAPEKWGKPFSALLGASMAQNAFETAAIGGKDSMSGTFKHLNVPPTLISFAVATGKVNQIVTPEFKRSDSILYCLEAKRDAEEIVDFAALNHKYKNFFEMAASGQILSAYAIGKGGVPVAAVKMAMGNGIGAELEGPVTYEASYGSILFECASHCKLSFEAKRVGKTMEKTEIVTDQGKLALSEAQKAWESTLEAVFPTKHVASGLAPVYAYSGQMKLRSTALGAKPKVFIPVFPGTNCEYDTARAFEKAGAVAEAFVFRNKTASDVAYSIEAIVKGIKNAQIIAIPGGFSAGDEPEGSGKFIASVLRNPLIAEAVMAHVREKDGLMIGICNGFQALVKLGLLPYGEIRALEMDAPTLTFNNINRHVARMARVRVASTMSPWLSEVNTGDIFQTAFSHGEGRFFASDAALAVMAENGQIATQYVDFEGRPTYDGAFNINGSVHAIEGVTSPDGRIFGKMGHIERVGKNLYKNIIGETDMKIFEAGVKYFK